MFFINLIPRSYLFAVIRQLLLYNSEAFAHIQNKLLVFFPNRYPQILAVCVCIIVTLASAALIMIRNARKNKAISVAQEQQILELKKEIYRRTNELDTQRESLASDFHDETGNLLSVIIHQATLLKLKGDADLQPTIENILCSSQQLYTSSKHFLWHLNNDSDDPQVLFQYLTAFGQAFFNKFDISFSVDNKPDCTGQAGRLKPHAAINLVFIFKEAMNNIVKHAEAREVLLHMEWRVDHLVITLADDGKWKEPDPAFTHHGLINIEHRCMKNTFTCTFQLKDFTGTRMEIAIPVM